MEGRGRGTGSTRASVTMHTASSTRATPAMRALRIEQIGSPLRESELPRPEPGPMEVLVRVTSAGICHSDVHYRNGTSTLRALPLTPGHEIAGRIEAVGVGVDAAMTGTRVCVHYLWTCGRCSYCSSGNEQFCSQGKMIGKDRDGGYAEYVAVPLRNVFALPESVSDEHGAVMMCSSATAFHALKKARLRVGESVAVFGLGGLGMSCVQLAAALGAERVFGVDIDAKKLGLAERLGCIPVSAANRDAVAAIRDATRGAGVDVSIELIGNPKTMAQAVDCLGVFGRAALAGITDRRFEVDSYRTLIGREAEIVGVSDHLASELPAILRLAETGKLDLSQIVARRVGHDAGAVNAVLDELERFSSPVRTVIAYE